MAFELKNGTGFIFKNKNKTANIHPEYKGDIKTPNGELLTISLWVKDGDNGKFFSASIQEPYKPEQKSQQKSQLKQSSPEPTDDLPF